MFEFKLPDLGEGIHEGEILQWHVKVGDAIKEFDPLVEIETDKAAVTITSPKTGTISELRGEVGDIVHVGNVIAVFDVGGAPAKIEEKKESAPVKKEEIVEEKVPAVIGASTGRAVPAAPATRRLARELGVDINMVTPSGPGGRVTAEDVSKFADNGHHGDSKVGIEEADALQAPLNVEHDEAVAVASFAARAANTIPFLDLEPLPDFSQFGPVTIEPLRSIRRKIAHKLVTSMILIPHVSHMDEADVTLLEEFRMKERQKREGTAGGKLTLLAFVIKAVTHGLKAAEMLNASLDPFKQEIIYKKYYNIGFAADTPKGLVVPVVKNADQMTIVGLSAEIERLSNAARDGSITADEMKGGTFTITNIGPLGGTALLATINYPEVAILAMGKVQEKPVVRNGEIVIRKMLPLTFAFDHRIADGADAARFVGEMARKLSDPSLLLLET